MIINRTDALGGVALMLIGGLFAAHAAMTLPIGNAFVMGPGYFPVALGSLLFLLGILVAFRAIGKSTPQLAKVSWRAVILVAAAPILFALTARGLGLGPSTLLAAITAAYSSAQMTFRRAILTAIGLSVFCALVFLYGVRLPLPLFGPWLGF